MEGNTVLQLQDLYSAAVHCNDIRPTKCMSKNGQIHYIKVCEEMSTVDTAGLLLRVADLDGSGGV